MIYNRRGRESRDRVHIPCLTTGVGGYHANSRRTCWSAFARVDQLVGVGDNQPFIRSGLEFDRRWVLHRRHRVDTARGIALRSASTTAASRRRIAPLSPQQHSPLMIEGAACYNTPESGSFSFKIPSPAQSVPP